MQILQVFFFQCSSMSKSMDVLASHVSPTSTSGVFMVYLWDAGAEGMVFSASFHVLMLSCIIALQWSDLLTACGFQMLLMSRKTGLHHRHQTPGPGMILRSWCNDERRRRRWRRSTNPRPRGRSEGRQGLQWETQVSVILLGFLGQQDSNHQYLFWIITYCVHCHDQKISQKALWHTRVLSKRDYRVKEIVNYNWHTHASYFYKHKFR